jgi:hypothetical protein
MPTILYEQQHGPRLCGAAALCMAYRSLGLETTQEAVWPHIEGKNLLGDSCAYTHRLGGDARSRGLDAVVVQARDPWAALQRCLHPGTRAILNHRPTDQAMTGHYTVLVQRGEHGVTVHDPQFGPLRRFSREELLELWARDFSPSYEVVGNNLVIIARPEHVDACPGCGGTLPEPIVCPKCGQDVALRPAAVLGCLREGCPANVWQRVHCPGCDATVWEGPSLPFSDMPAGFQHAGAGRGSPTLSDILANMNTVLADATASATGPARESLERIGAQMAQAQAEVLPQLQQQYQQAQETLRTLQSGLAAAKAKQAAGKPAKPPAPAEPAPHPRRKVDPNLGQVLRKKLLAEIRRGP